MNINEIRELAQIMNENSLSEINIEENGTKVQLVKNMQVVVNAPVQAQVVADSTVQTESKPAMAEGKLIKSPTVGIFYSAPSPETEPYVQIGTQIKSGDVICIIEAMKLMNEIQADIEGEVVEILVGNGQVVEYDQPLFRIG